MRLALFLCCYLILSQALSACPFCNPGEADIFGDIADAQAVVLAEKIETRKYKINKVLKGKAKLGRIVVAGEPRGKLGKSGTLLLTTAGPPNLRYWSDPPRMLDSAELGFAQRCLEVSKLPSSKQWDFAAKHLQNESSEISAAAYNLLASAPLVEVQKRARLVGEKKLRDWVKNGKIAPERRALYLLMSFQNWPRSELTWIEKKLFDKNLSPASPLLGPLAVCFLRTKGHTALPQIKKRFYAPELPAGQTTSLNRALVLVAEQGANSKLKAGIKDVFHSELTHPQRGAFVLAPLALWKDETPAKEVEALFHKNQNVTWIKVAVIRYFRTLGTPKSKAALARLSKSAPELVRRTTDPYRKRDLGIE